jgi:hypothetical protein
VYGGDFFGATRSEWTPDTLEERPFEMARARRLFDEANERWRASAFEQRRRVTTPFGLASLRARAPTSGSPSC